jgi:hypothetical protein
MTTVGFGDSVPSCGLARFITSLWTVASYMAMSLLTAIVTTILTADNISVSSVNALGDVTGTLCVEEAYALLEAFIALDPNAPSALVRDTVPGCMQRLLAGEVQALITDRPLGVWYTAEYGLPGLDLSGPLSTNPLGFLYAANSTLRALVNPGVVASLTDPDWVPRAQSLVQYYFAAPPNAQVAEPAVTVSPALIAACAVLTAVTLLLHLAHMRGWLREPRALRAALARLRAVVGQDARPASPEAHAYAAQECTGPAALLAELRAATEAQQEALDTAAAAGRRVLELEGVLRQVLSGKPVPDSAYTRLGLLPPLQAPRVARQSALMMLSSTEVLFHDADAAHDLANGGGP